MPFIIFRINLINMKDESNRPYRMTARAASTAATGERIIDATVELFWEQLSGEIRLEDVAERAGVTVQTVIRRFGGRQGLLTAAIQREAERVRRQRGSVTPGDIERAVSNLVEHYEELGDRVIRLLSEETRNPALAEIAETGRETHREWCRYVFGPFLTGMTGTARSRRLAQFVAICDVYTWSLLRRQGNLSRTQTEMAIVEMLAPFIRKAD